MKKDLPAPKKHPVRNVPVNYVMRFSGPVTAFFPFFPLPTAHSHRASKWANAKIDPRMVKSSFLMP
jgi:hypothetical protein